MIYYFCQICRPPTGGYNWVETTFDETPPMSTYLVALLISDFSCNTTVALMPISQQIDVSVCTRPNAADQMGLILESAVKIPAFFENFYQAKFPLPKLGKD